MMQENHLRTVEDTIQLEVVGLCPGVGLIGGHLDQPDTIQINKGLTEHLLGHFMATGA